MHSHFPLGKVLIYPLVQTQKSNKGTCSTWHFYMEYLDIFQLVTKFILKMINFSLNFEGRYNVLK